MQPVTLYKIGSLIGLLLISVFSSLLPLKFAAHNPQYAERILAHFSFYTGGIFLGAGLLHMLPDAITEQAENQLFNKFPVALLTAAFGFISIWALEKIQINDELSNAPIERERMVAVSAKAWLKSANICYITVAPTTTYGTLNSSTLKVSNIPPRSISSPALSAIHNGNEQIHNITMTPKNNALNSAVIVPMDQLPNDIQKSLGNKDNDTHSHTPKTTLQRANSDFAKSGSHRHRRSNSSVSTITELSNDSDGDNGISLSSYQNSAKSDSSHVIDMKEPSSALSTISNNSAQKISPQHKRLIINTMNESNHNIGTTSGNSSSDKSQSPRSGTLRQQAHNNVHNKKQHSKHPSSVRSLQFANQCNSPNRGIHEHIHHGITGNNHTDYNKDIVLLPSDDESKPLLLDKHTHDHNHSHGHSHTHNHSHNHDLIGHDESGPHHEHTDVHHHHIVIPGNLFLPLALTTVFSLHSVIEGMALGIQSKLSNNFISILIAITSHKAIEAITVSSNFLKEGVEYKTSIPIILIYCLMTPIGILIGLISDYYVSSDNTVLVTTEVSAFAAGSFVYLAIHEISDESCCNKVSGKYQVLLMVFGLITMAVLAIWT